MKKIIFALSLATLSVVACKNETSSASTTKTVSTKNLKTLVVNPDSESEKFSYTIGMIIANTLKGNGVDSINYGIIERAFNDSQEEQIAYSLASREAQALATEEVDLSSLDTKIMQKGMYDVLEGDTTLLTMQEGSTSYRAFLENNQTKVAERNLEASKTFLEGNKTKEGVKVTDTGLQHLEIKKGEGKVPTNKDVVEVVFSGENLVGKEFLSTPVEQPAYIDLSDNSSEIPGLMEGVKLYPSGSEFKLFVPSNLAFGANRVSPEVGPNSTILLHVKDVKIMDAKQKAEYKKAKKQYLEQMKKMQRQQQMRR